MRPVAGAPPVCSRLSSGDGAAIVVADFQAHNNAPRLSKLLKERAVGQPIYRVDPRDALSGDRLYASLSELADEAVATLRSEESAAAADQPVFIVSHCSAAGLSLRIADQLAGARPVTAILVQPSWPGDEHVTERFAEFYGKLRAGSRPCPDLNGDPWSCVAGMEQVMRDGLAELATRLGLGEAPLAFSEMLVSYRTWLAFLLACRNDQPSPSDSFAVSVLTDQSDFVLPGTAADRCRISTPPPADRPDAVTPELADSVLEQIKGY